MAIRTDHVFSCEAPLKKLILRKSGGGFVLFCASDYDLFVYCFNGPANSSNSWLNATLQFQCKLDSMIIELLPHEKKVFVVIEDGKLKVLESSDGGDVYESDIFEEDSPEMVTSWKLQDVCCVPGSPTVLSASSSKLGILVLCSLQNSSHIFLLTDSIISSCKIEDSVCSSGSSCVVDITSMSFDFMNVWLSHVERSGEFLFVGLSNGSLYCLPLSLPLKYYCVYKSVHSIVLVSWFEERQSNRFDAVIIVLDSGTVVRLTPIGEEVSYPFLPFLNSAISLRNCIVTLEEIDSRFLLLNDPTNKCKIFPVDSISGICYFSETSKLLLVSDNSGLIYLIDSECFEPLNKSVDVRKTGCCPLPHANDLQKLISSSIQLEQINRNIKTLDEYLRAKSLVARADILKDHFKLSAKVVQVLDDKHTVRLKLSFGLAGVVFSKDFWKLDLTVCTSTYSLSYQKDLLKNISYEQNLIQLITLPIQFDLLYNFDLKLVSYVESKNVELYLPLGKVEMNAGHFLFPNSLKELCYVSDDCANSPWNDNENKYYITLTLPETPSDLGIFLTELLADSKALWRQTEWNTMSTTHSASCVLFGYNVDIKINANKLRIESNNLKICLAVKFAMLVKITKNEKNVKDHLAQCLVGWNQAENIIRLSSEPHNHVTDLYNIIKTDML